MRRILRSVSDWILYGNRDTTPEQPYSGSPPYHQGVIEAMQVFEIENGYIVHFESNHRNVVGGGPPKQKPAVYCANHEEVAKLLITTRALGRINGVK